MALVLELNRLRLRPKVVDTRARAMETGVGMSKRYSSLIPQFLASEIEDFFVEVNEKIAKRVFGRATLVPQSTAVGEPSRISIDDFSPRELVSLLGGVVARLDSRVVHLENESEVRRKHRPLPDAV